uniref:Glycosyltransferase 2-like domain-containing protein n=1 Tax=Phenylobacterium glaciei TaxID=2803784 RepID=A0A974SAG2_9CAUL|nr:hypothetical protein JKL49_04090 [Phenylobacterium glaciei]
MAQAASIFLATPAMAVSPTSTSCARCWISRPPARARRRPDRGTGGGDALITRARAAMADKFLKSGASHLLFVDADIGFKPEQVFRLLDADRDLVGASIPSRASTGPRSARRLPTASAT